MTWELIWMLVILKIPVVYLCLVVWWAIRAKPLPLEPALKSVASRARPEARMAFLTGPAPAAPPWAARLSRRAGTRGWHGQG